MQQKAFVPFCEYLVQWLTLNSWLLLGAALSSVQEMVFRSLMGEPKLSWQLGATFLHGKGCFTPLPPGSEGTPLWRRQLSI